MSDRILAFYVRQINKHSRVLTRTLDPVKRIDSLQSLFRILVRLHRLPHTHDLTEILAELGEKLLIIFETELEISHSYCSLIQDLLRDHRLLINPLQNRQRVSIRQRHELEQLEAQREQVVRLIMRRTQ
jgi:hypothetical protein